MVRLPLSARPPRLRLALAKFPDSVSQAHRDTRCRVAALENGLQNLRERLLRVAVHEILRVESFHSNSLANKPEYHPVPRLIHIHYYPACFQLVLAILWLV